MPDEPKEHVGLCLFKKKWILLSASLQRKYLLQVAMHEMIHACHGAIDGNNDPAWWEHHERSVGRLEKSLFKALTEECALRFPPLPHAWRAFRRRLLKHEKQVVL